MSIEEELKAIFDSPLLQISEREMALFDIPSDMKKVVAARSQPDYYAQRKPCEDFHLYQNGFARVHSELRAGKRNLVKASRTDNMQEGHYYVVDGQMVYLQSVGKAKRAPNGTKDARTRCIFENGTESDLLLQTLRKNVVENGYAITETEEEMAQSLIGKLSGKLQDGDKVTGYIYVLSSLSTNPEIAELENLYKIGFTTQTVEERIANAVNDPTYLMAPVRIEASYKIINMGSHRFETLIHQVLGAVQLQVSVMDGKGNICHPKEWYIVPMHMIENIIARILDGTIVHYIYNPQLKCLEKVD